MGRRQGSCESGTIALPPPNQNENEAKTGLVRSVALWSFALNIIADLTLTQNAGSVNFGPILAGRNVRDERPVPVYLPDVHVWQTDLMRDH